MSGSQIFQMAIIAHEDSERGDLKEVQTASSLDSNHSSSNPTGLNEKALLRKLDLKLLPPLTVLYLLSFLDRSNGT